MNQSAFENEPEIRVLSVTGAVGLMVLLLALLIFIRFSQTIPQPPPIQFVEVNFGTDAIGSGRIQTYNKASDSPNAVDVKKAEKTPNPKVTTTPRVEKTPVAPVPTVDVKEKAKAVTEKPVIASRVESPVTVPEKAEPKKTKASPASSPAPPGEAPPKKTETVDPNALYKRSSGGAGANGTVGKAAGTGGNNNGDDAGGVGDKGNPKGNINAKEFYGTPNGGSTGVAFDVSGWSLAGKPNVNDDSDETGKIVFQLTVDDAGNIIAVKTRQTTVGASVVEVYRRAVQRLKLRPKSANTPPTSTGTITFIITSK